VRAFAPLSGNPRVNAPTEAPLRATHNTAADADGERVAVGHRTTA